MRREMDITEKTFEIHIVNHFLCRVHEYKIKVKQAVIGFYGFDMAHLSDQL